MIKIQFWVRIMKPPIFGICLGTQFSFLQVILHTNTISHIFCICLRWNYPNLPILTNLNFRLTFSKINEQGFITVEAIIFYRQQRTFPEIHIHKY